MTAPRRVTQRELAKRVTEWEAKHFLVGLSRQKAGDQLGAMQKYRKILSRNPSCWPALFSAAVCAHQACEHTWAVHHLRRIVKALPVFVEAWYNLGTIVQCLGEYAEAEAALRQALAIAPDFVAARTNLGNALLGQGRTEEAQAEFAHALTLKPQDAEASWNLSHVLVLTGEWAKGWAAYEARWQIPGFVEMNAIQVADDRADIPLPWRGAPLEGKHLVVVEEQGWGDTFMCLRYAPQLRAMGARVTWAVRPEAMRLTMATVAPDQVVSIRDPIPGADYVVACMTLHHRLGTTPETVPGANGYLLRAA